MFKDLKKHQLVLLIALVIVAAFFRFWLIRDYLVFLGDEGRDMIIMRKMILEMRPVFIGPTASVGGFYLGPIYYWMAAPFLALTRFDPVGPSIMVAAIGFATVLLLYKFLKSLVGFYPAIFVGFLYATSPLIVRYSRSSWNPNPLPFFALLLMYFVYLGITRNKKLYFVLAGMCFGIAIQLHYLSVMLVPITFLIILFNVKIKSLPKLFLLGISGALITFSPFLFFELKHHFPNFITIYEFVTRPSTHGFRNFNFIDAISNFGNILLENLSSLKGSIITRIFFWGLVLGGIAGLVKNFKDKNKKLAFSIGVIWFIGGLLFLKYYSGQIFDYYFGFMFPAPFFLYGLITGSFWNKKVFKYTSIAVTLVCTAWFIQNGFFRSKPNKLINQTESIAKFVIDKTEGHPYNFALISDHNSDHAYRYFLEVNGRQPTELETQITNQLLVVCEGDKCAPLGHPIWEIAGFGRAEIQNEWQMPRVNIRVFRLVHWPGVPNPAGKPAKKG